MKKGFISVLALFFCTNIFCQFSNHGPVIGIGFGGLKGAKLKVENGFNAEIGYLIKYNYSERSSFRTFITYNFYDVTLQNGKKVAFDYFTPSYRITDAKAFTIKYNVFSQHIDYNFIVLEDILDLSAGLFYEINFSSNFLCEEEDRIYYDASDAEIKYLLDNNAHCKGYPTEYFVSDQIYTSLTENIDYGIYFGLAAGTYNLKFLLRYDHYLPNYYSDYSNTKKLKKNFIKLGLTYLF